MTLLQRWTKRWVILRKSLIACAWDRWMMRLYGCTVPASCYIYGTPHMARLENKVVLGERVMLCSLPYLYRLGQEYKCVLATGKYGVIRIGDDAGLNGTAIYAEKEVTIGARVMIGAGSRITDIDCHPVDVIPRRYAANTPPRPVIIEDDVWMGVGVTVLPGVRIGKGSVIGAGSIVTNDIPPMVVAGGAPARVLRPLATNEAHPPSQEIDTH